MRPIHITAAATIALSLSLLALPASAGSAHFVGDPTFTTSDTTVTVAAKEAGLGNLPQITVQLTGTAECVNGGGHNPPAGNKSSFVVTATEPVQNGKADYTLTATPVFQPACSPPMMVEFTSLLVTDETNGIAAVPVPG